MNKYPELPDDRARGRTTRTLWRALLAASEGTECVVLVETARLAEWTFDYLCRLIWPVADGLCPRGPFQFDRCQRCVTFPNGVGIVVRTFAWWDEYGRGVRNVKVIEDHRT